MPTLRGLKGLTASDRSQSDQIAINQQNEEPNYLVSAPSVASYDSNKSLQDIHDKQAIMQNAYQEALDKYTDEIYHVGPSVKVADTRIEDVAMEVSPYFRKYRYSDYINLSNEDWRDLARQYTANLEVYGEEVANRQLDNSIKDEVASNQSWWEQALLGFRGMGASAAGAAISTAGAFKGMIDYIDGTYEKKDYLNGFENFMSSVMDNDWTRYGNDVVQYGTLNKNRQQWAKQLGISELQIVQSTDQEKKLINATTPWVALQSGGFTLASMLTGYGEAKLAGMVFKGLGSAAKAAQTGAQLTKTLTALQKAKNFTNKFIIPGMVGTTEGLIEGLSTKQQIEDEGIQMVNQRQQAAVTDEVNRRLGQYKKVLIPTGVGGDSATVAYVDEKGNQINIDNLYQQVWNEFSPKYQESLEQVEYASNRAGLNNFYVNSAINGMINSTLKAGLQAPSVRKALQSSRMFGWAQPKGNFNITGTGASTVVTPKFGVAKQIWNVAKEPLGEFAEEYLQSVSDATMRGGAENNIHDFVDNKYLGDGSAIVGDSFSEDLGAALTAFTGSLVDKETIQSGIYGAISSVMGTPAMPHKTRTGRLRADGTAETTLFGRGLNELGKRESQLERLGRIMPWRSGITGAYRDTQIEKKEAQEAANSLQEWLRDPDNKGKFDGLVGTFSWAKDMEDSSRGNDEFGYRNSTLGKTINDVFMLQHLKGTQMYDSYINQLSEVANLEEGTETANNYIKAMRDNVNVADPSVSDQDVLATLKRNASQMLSTIDKIQQESDKIDKLLGNVDKDTKQSLIYGQLMLDDWNKRGSELNQELSNITIENSVDHSSEVTDKQKDILARYGSFAKAKSELSRLENQESNIKQDIKNLESRKNLTDAERKTLKSKKVKAKTIRKEIKNLNPVREIEGNISTVLNEQEIMALDPIARANMLLKGKQKLYTATHEGEETTTKEFFSPEQQAVIDNLIARGTAQDRDFFSKIVDAGRIENSTKTFLEQYNSILTDPSSFNNYVYAAKRAAADIATKKKYQALNSMTEYKPFAREMDKLFREGTTREQELITKAFKNNGNANYEKYVGERNLIQGLINQVVTSDEFKDMSDNDADMFLHTITYLSDKGVDFSNGTDVVEALSSLDEDGVLEFRKYVNDVNQSLPEVERTAFTSVEEALQVFNNVMRSYVKQEIEIESNARPVEVTPTAPEQSAPTVSPEPTPSPSSGGVKNFWEVGSSTPEGGHLTDDGTVVDTETQETETTSNPFRENSNDEVAKAADIVLNTINNAPRMSDEDREQAREYVESLGEYSFESVEEFTDKISSYANARDSQSEDGTDSVASLLRQAIAKAIKFNIDSTPATTGQERKVSPLFDRKRAEINRENQRLNTTYNMFPNATTGSSFIASVNIDYIRQNYPDGVLAKYYDKYHIEDALRDRVLEGNPDILFITDEELTNNVAQELGSKYNAETSLPIVAVVEAKDGPITIDDKNYQPISVMSSTGRAGSAGADNMVSIRKLALSNTGTQVVKAQDGKPVVTKSYGPPKAYPVDQNYRGRNNVVEIGISDLNPAERIQVEASSKSARRGMPAYQRAKRGFIKNLEVRDMGGRKALFFKQNRLNGGINPIEVFVSPINETTARNSNTLFSELDGSPESVINFNSRTSRAAKAIGNFLGSFSTKEMIFELDDTGHVVPTDVTKGVLSGIASNLEKGMSNFINIPVSQGWVYSVEPTENVVGDNRIMHLSLTNTNTGESIPLADIHEGMIEDEIKYAQASIIRNLIMDGDQVRMSSATDSFAKWNVPYADVDKSSENKGAANNISDIYDDGILGAAATTFNYRIQGIAVHNPFKVDGTPTFTQVANRTNAQPATPVDTPTVTANNQVNSGEAIVDSDTGTVLEGEVKQPKNAAHEQAARVVKQIEEDSRAISLSEDGSTYVDKSGRRYLRVTSVISADEQAGDRFDSSSPWVTPSTNIGTGVDEFVRDFFAGKIEGRMDELMKHYPNATQEQLKKFADQLSILRNNLTANGLAIVPRDVTVTGAIDVLDAGGNMHSVDVAGTLDLLAYDGNGNFFIFDMKTHHSKLNDGNMKKYGRQLSMYKRLLEDKYGVKVGALNIIPISVDYPAPLGVKGGSADYKVSTEKANQLMIDGNEFRNANPVLEDILPVSYTEPHILWDKLTDSERGIASDIETIVQNPVEAAMAEPVAGTVDPTLGVTFSDDYLGDMFGDSAIVEEGFNMDFNSRTTPIPTELQWSSLTDEQKENLEMMGFNETSWSDLEDDEMKHKLECMK